MLDYLVDIQRVRQYFNHVTRSRQVLDAVRADTGFLDQVRRGLLPLPTDRHPEPADPFPPFSPRPLPDLAGRRVAVVASGGSGALASVLGVVRALDEAGAPPVAYGVCSGSALFGLPLAAGRSVDEVARFTLGLRPADYLDADWLALATMPLRLGRGWAGVVRGAKLETVFREFLGDITLGELTTPCWLPIWNIEQNRLEYLGPDTHPDLPVARAVRMAVALPLAIQPNPLDGGYWLDGGIVDIFPAEPFVTADRCDLAVVVNCFYPPGLDAVQEVGWHLRPWSILHVASQTRTMQHLQLARRSLAALDAATEVLLVEPVPYDKVHGAGLYGQFLDNREWATFAREGYDVTTSALRDRAPVRRSTSRVARSV
ncbi:MAG: patatin-like phospholipase family protein [Actinomycetia bacterium]|nr:patatin-like phospholipase family protein [Actinomycetes bacterium]